MMSRAQRRVNRIALVNAEGQLETTDPEGRDRRRLSGGPGAQMFYQFPAWSPDGRFVAAVGGNRESAGVFAFEDRPGPSAPRQMYFSRTHAPIYLYWSPDGRRVSFIANHPAGLGLHLAALESGDSQLLATGQPFFWDWTPDSRQVLIHTGMAGQGARLAFLDAADGSLAQEIARPGLFDAPGISPSGEHWAYARLTLAGESELIVDGLVADKRRRLSHKGRVALGWSPARDQLAFTSPPTPAQHWYGPLRVVDVAGSRARTVVDELVLAFFWSPDGSRIAYVTLAESEEPAGRTGLPGLVTAFPPELRRNGNRRAHSDSAASQTTLRLNLGVVELDSRRTQVLTTFEPTALFVNQFLPFFDQYALSHRLWSPAGDALVLPLTEGNTDRIYIVPVDGGPPRLLADGFMAYWSRQ